MPLIRDSMRGRALRGYQVGLGLGSREAEVIKQFYRLSSLGSELRRMHLEIVTK
jgi:hypothetical protein